MKRNRSMRRTVNIEDMRDKLEPYGLTLANRMIQPQRQSAWQSGVDIGGLGAAAARGMENTISEANERKLDKALRDLQMGRDLDPDIQSLPSSLRMNAMATGMSVGTKIKDMPRSGLPKPVKDFLNKMEALGWGNVEVNKNQDGTYSLNPKGLPAGAREALVNDAARLNPPARVNIPNTVPAALRPTTKPIGAPWQNPDLAKIARMSPAFQPGTMPYSPAGSYANPAAAPPGADRFGLGPVPAAADRFGPQAAAPGIYSPAGGYADPTAGAATALSAPSPDRFAGMPGADRFGDAMASLSAPAEMQGRPDLSSGFAGLEGGIATPNAGFTNPAASAPQQPSTLSPVNPSLEAQQNVPSTPLSPVGPSATITGQEIGPSLSPNMMSPNTMADTPGPLTPPNQNPFSFMANNPLVGTTQPLPGMLPSIPTNLTPDEATVAPNVVNNLVPNETVDETLAPLPTRVIKTPKVFTPDEALDTASPPAPMPAPSLSVADVYGGKIGMAASSDGKNFVSRDKNGTISVTNQYGKTTAMTPGGYQSAYGGSASAPAWSNGENFGGFDNPLTGGLGSIGKEIGEGIGDLGRGVGSLFGGGLAGIGKSAIGLNPDRSFASQKHEFAGRLMGSLVGGVAGGAAGGGMGLIGALAGGYYGGKIGKKSDFPDKPKNKGWKNDRGGSGLSQRDLDRADSPGYFSSGLK